MAPRQAGKLCIRPTVQLSTDGGHVFVGTFVSTFRQRTGAKGDTANGLDWLFAGGRGANRRQRSAAVAMPAIVCVFCGAFGGLRYRSRR